MWPQVSAKARLLRLEVQSPQDDQLKLVLSEPKADHVYGVAEGSRPVRNSAGDLRDAGRALGRAAFPESISRPILAALERGPVVLLLSALDAASSQLPWEFIQVDAICKRPLVFHPHVTFVRDGGSASSSVPRTFQGRALIALADPGSPDNPPIPFAETELASIERALATPECRRWKVEVIRYATPDALARALRERPVDVLHFIGHGQARSTGGALVMESGRPRTEALLYAEDLAETLLKAGTPLLVLSACCTAGGVETFGAEMARAGVPAVLGMQNMVSDHSCGLFFRAFYAALAEGSPIEEAVRQGRAATSGTAGDWGSPVLTLGASVLNPQPSASLPKQGPEKLPSDDRPFIGRAKECQTVTSMLAKNRLISVVAMGGMGKTRLALQVASGLSSRFEDGALFVECETLTSAEELSAAIAASLDSREQDALRALAEREVLLVLDCFEHLAPEANFLSRLLRTCPRVRVLVTSRVVLRLEEEAVFELEPLGRRKSPGPRSEGIQLFLSAARSVVPGLRFDPEERRLVRTIVEDLEAVPLALLLAAGRLRHMGIRDLANRLRERRLETLRRRPLGETDRHAELLRVIDDSLQLLDERERHLAKALSVFRGGFFIEDALAVLGSDDDPMESLVVLRDHSVLLAQRLEGRMRYRFLDTVREYLDGWPDPADHAERRRRHAVHSTQLARQVRSALQQGDWKEGRERLWIDIGNFRSAARFATKSEDPALVCGIARALARPYFESGLRTEFLELISAAGRFAKTCDDVSLQIELLGLEGAQMRRDGRIEQAEASWEQRVSLCQSTGDVLNEADTLLDLGDLALANLDDQAVHHALQRFDACGIADPKMISSRLLIEARYELRFGHTSEALALTRRAAAEHAKVSRPRQALFVWSNLAALYRELGAMEESERMCETMIEEALNRGYFQSAGRGLLDLALVSSRAGQWSRSAASLAVASLIPRAVSPELKRECDGLRQAFPVEHTHLLVAADLAATGRPWQELALETVSSGRVPTFS